MFIPWYYCFGFCTPVTGMMVWFIVLVMGFPMVQISIFGNTIVGIWRILPILYRKNCICLGVVFWMRVYVVGTRDWLDTSTVIRHDMSGRCGLRWPPSPTYESPRKMTDSGLLTSLPCCPALPLDDPPLSDE